MLDLAFVRNNLPLVEEKLRLRGMDPTEVLGDFRSVDAERRSFITTLETAQKRRNELSPKIGALKQAEKKGIPFFSACFSAPIFGESSLRRFCAVSSVVMKERLSVSRARKSPSTS